MEFNARVSLPWMILGDYNNVLKFDDKCNGADVTPYEIKDFEIVAFMWVLPMFAPLVVIIRGLITRFGAKLIGKW